MAKTAVCRWPKKNYCHNACCYITFRKVREREAEGLGLENLVKKGKKFFLKSKDHPRFGPCVFLDEEGAQCGIYSQRPRACRRYDCTASYRLMRLIDEARHYQKKKVSK